MEVLVDVLMEVSAYQGKGGRGPWQPLTLLAGEEEAGAWFAELLCFSSKGQRV